MAIVILLVLLVAVAFRMLNNNGTDILSYDGLVSKVNKGEIEGIYFSSDYTVNVLYTQASDVDNDTYAKRVENFRKGKYADATAIITYRNNLVLALENYEKEAIESGKAYNMPEIWLNDPSEGSFASYILPILSFVVLIGLAIFLFISMRGKGGAGGAMNFGKTKSKAATHVKVRFTDVAGAEEEKVELQEVVEFLKSPQKFRAVGAKIPKGVLLVGPPGTGKTLFAKAVAGEANVPFFSISGSDFVEMFVGVGASRVRDLFEQAKKAQPCIVFIDEIDAVGRKRGAGLGGGNDEREQTLNQLLVQMDGFEENESIVIMAATNRADVLDPALLRPGRFDRQIYVNLPDVRGREAIFRVHARNKPLSPEIDFKNLARLTTGFSGADIANLLNESAIIAARENRKVINMVDILEGINKVIAGPQKRSRVVTERDKRITAYHEAGHALVGRLLKNCDAVQEVSIIPRGRAAGYTISRPKSDDNHTTLSHLNDTIAMTMGGRAAEAIIIQDITTGASQDIKQATSIARSMVTEWGMSPALKNVYFGGEQEVFIGRDYQTQASYSDEVAALIDSEIRKIVDTAYDRAVTVITENVEKLHTMVALLYAHETIYGDEVDLIMEGKSVDEINAYIEDKKAKREKEAKEKAEALRKAETPNPLGDPKDFIVTEDPQITITVVDNNDLKKEEVKEELPTVPTEVIEPKDDEE
ncbi:MAG: ATP-dependent zinc metalloprotease FtsH [Clostridia bacterium]|nr:ATP-dependent zinc metalloprotease FtsH [Clostridia bacterium]